MKMNTQELISNINEEYLHPIIMSQPMMRANLDGLKSVTRRMSGLDDINENAAKWRNMDRKVNGRYYFRNGEEARYIKCPYGDVGHFLWVRETCFIGVELDEHEHLTDIPLTLYRADTGDKRPCDMSDNHCLHLFGADKKDWPKWKPSIHMPKTACRMLLEITGIGIERLEFISEDSAVNEGVKYLSYKESGVNHPSWMDYSGKSRFCITASSSYITLWESINGKGSWEQDKKKFVWVVNYKIIK